MGHDLDGRTHRNVARLINHSCEPNCEAWSRGKRIFIHALRDIAEGKALGDTTTLADPSVVARLKEQYQDEQ